MFAVSVGALCSPGGTVRRGIMIASLRFDEADDDDDNDVDGMIHPTLLYSSFAFADSFIRLSLTFVHARPLGAFFPTHAQ